MLMVLTRVPHPILRKVAKQVSAADLKSGIFEQLVAEMKQAMADNRGVGLAANQIGNSEALFVIDEKLAIEHGVPAVYANPVITEYGKENDVLEEGCLSLPGIWIQIPRSKKIMFKAMDMSGKKLKFRARGMLSRVLQHETDHLNGTTIQQRTGTNA